MFIHYFAVASVCSIFTKDIPAEHIRRRVKSNVNMCQPLDKIFQINDQLLIPTQSTFVALWRESVKYLLDCIIGYFDRR